MPVAIYPITENFSMFATVLIGPLCSLIGVVVAGMGRVVIEKLREKNTCLKELLDTVSRIKSEALIEAPGKRTLLYYEMALTHWHRAVNQQPMSDSVDLCGMGTKYLEWSIQSAVDALALRTTALAARILMTEILLSSQLLLEGKEVGGLHIRSRLMELTKDREVHVLLNDVVYGKPSRTTIELAIALRHLYQFMSPYVHFSVQVSRSKWHPLGERKTKVDMGNLQLPVVLADMSSNFDMEHRTHTIKMVAAISVGCLASFCFTVALSIPFALYSGVSLLDDVVQGHRYWWRRTSCRVLWRRKRAEFADLYTWPYYAVGAHFLL